MKNTIRDQIKINSMYGKTELLCSNGNFANKIIGLN